MTLLRFDDGAARHDKATSKNQALPFVISQSSSVICH
jgi:hypothetical protein